jgi:hypothetical protein
MTYISVRTISALWLVLALAGTSSVARAGAAYQGAAYQGAAYQGAAYQGAAYQGAAYQGAAYQGAAYQGAAYQGAAYQGAAYQGAAYQGAAYQGAAYQGAAYQGAAYQGAAYQGAAYQASTLRDGWLEGAQLFGTIVLPVTKRSAVIAITDFRGDAVVAVVWDSLAATKREVEMHPRDLVGLTWWGGVCTQGYGCAPVMYRIADVSRDTVRNTMRHHSSNDDVWLYQIAYLDTSGPKAWLNACDAAPGMRASNTSATRGLFVNGRWGTDGSWTRDGYTFSCPDGVIAKCVRSWGYKPWKSLSASDLTPVSLLPLHLACVRAARADYCGNGISHTRNGTLIDIADRFGFNIHEDIGEFRDEAAFGPDGAAWVNAPRWPTGHLRDGSWLFATCTRPMAAPHTRPLLLVRSAILGAESSSRKPSNGTPTIEANAK